LSPADYAQVNDLVLVSTEYIIPSEKGRVIFLAGNRNRMHRPAACRSCYIVGRIPIALLFRAHGPGRPGLRRSSPGGPGCMRPSLRWQEAGWAKIKRRLRKAADH